MTPRLIDNSHGIAVLATHVEGLTVPRVRTGSLENGLVLQQNALADPRDPRLCPIHTVRKPLLSRKPHTSQEARTAHLEVPARGFFWMLFFACTVGLSRAATVLLCGLLCGAVLCRDPHTRRDEPEEL